MVVDYAVTADSFQALATRPWPGAASASGVFDLAPDGKHLIIGGDFTPRGEPKGNLHVTILVNWFDEVRRRVPGGK
jgi:hypothetical protein